VGFEVFTAGGTGWVMDIRYYDFPMSTTTTFPFRTTSNKKGHGGTMA
jgi:hypothetical protein